VGPRADLDAVDKVRCPCALTEHHAMEAYWGSKGIDPLIL